MSVGVSSNNISIDESLSSSVKRVKGLAKDRKEVDVDGSVSGLVVSNSLKSSDLRVEFSSNESSRSDEVKEDESVSGVLAHL